MQYNLGRILFNARLIGPLARLQRAFDVELGALLNVLLDDLAQRLGEDDDAVPLGLFFLFARRLVAPGFRRRDAQVGDRPSVLRAADLGSLPTLPTRITLFTEPAISKTPLSLALGELPCREPAAKRGIIHICAHESASCIGAPTPNPSPPYPSPLSPARGIGGDVVHLFVQPSGDGADAGLRVNVLVLF